MTCPRCKSENVTVQIQTTGLHTKEKNKGIIHAVCRLTLICFTCGLWLLLPSQRGSSKSKVSSQKIAVCQTCGHSWKV